MSDSYQSFDKCAEFYRIVLMKIRVQTKLISHVLRRFWPHLELAGFTNRRVATYKPGKPGLTGFSETLALYFIQFLSLRKMKVQDRQNGPSDLPLRKKLAGYVPDKPCQAELKVQKT